MKGKFNLISKFKEAGMGNCFISEITLAELKFGVANSQQIEKNRKTLASFLKIVNVLPIIQSLDVYADEKTRLRKIGKPIGDFDLLIGSTSLVHKMVMVTNNISEFSRIDNIIIEDWSKTSASSTK